MYNKNNTTIIGAKVPRRINTILKDVCKKRGEDVSDFIRREVYTELARLSYLSPEEKKALGVNLMLPTSSRRRRLLNSVAGQVMDIDLDVVNVEMDAEKSIRISPVAPSAKTEPQIAASTPKAGAPAC